jgi:outer membrane biosynthesis protein TonB
MEAPLMKVLGVISTTAVFLLLGAAVPAFAQEEHHEEAAKPATHEEAAKPVKQEEAKPAKQEEAKPAKQESQAKPANEEKQAKPAKQTQQAKSEKQESQAKPAKEEKQTKPAKQTQQAKSEKQEGRGKTTGEQHGQPQRSASAQERQRSMPALRLSARGSGRIPDDRFRSNFGSGHTFVINEPVMVGGFSRFQYGGFWFGFENPWPEGWYYTDNVYVDFIDGGYYLCNPYYPGARVGISVVI